MITRISLHWHDLPIAITGLLSLMLLCFNQANAQGVLTNGAAHDGAVSAAGATNIWTVAANSGDRITVQIAKLSGGAGFTPRLELFAPDGATLGVDSDAVAARLDIQAHVSGTFTAVVRDLNQTGTGTYRLRLAQVPGAFIVPVGDEGGALINGTNQQGMIDVGDLDLWTITANAGDRIVLQIAELTGGASFTPMIEVFSPTGARLGINSGGVAARLDLQAGVDGNYTVLVSDANQTGSGTYQLRLAQVPGAFVVPAGDEGGALADALDQDGAIVLGDFDLWTFSASPGDRITLLATELTGGAGFAPLIELFAPNGARKSVAQGASAATIDAVIEVNGTYTVLVSDANQVGAGTYRLRLTRGTIAPPGPNVLVNGTTHLGSISSAGESNIWTFAASAGETIVVRAGETATAGLVPWLRLSGPTGALLASDFNPAAAEVSIRATNSGTFSVAIADGSVGRNQTGNYRIALAKTGYPLTISPSDEGGSLTNGLSYLGSIETGDVDAWTFTANAGESIAVWMGEVTAGSPLLPWLRIYGPDGVILGNDFNATAAEVTVRATNSGTFLVVVGDGNNGFGGTGNYRLSLAKTGSPLLISLSDEGGPLTNGASYLAAIETGDVDVWTFTANAGESIIVRAGETAAATLYPWIRLFGPNGVLLSEDFNAAAAEATFRATNSGTFTVILGDGNNGRFGSGNYRLNLAKTGAPLAISPSDEGGPVVNGTTYLGTIETGDIDAWTFTASAGENIIVRMGETAAASALYPWLRLYGPNGASLDADFNAAAAEVTFRATNSGTFLVVVGDGNSGLGGSGNYRLSLAKTGSPLTISPSDEGGTVVNGATYLGTIETGDIDAWTFAANVGETIVVRIGETILNSGLYPWLRLYSPNGVLLDADFNAAAAEVTFRATNSGIFQVVVGDGNSGLGGVGDYRLTLAQTGEPVTVSVGDESGALTGASAYDGNIDVGDIDVWTFTACGGDILSLSVTEMVSGSGLYPWMRLYGRDGVVLNTVSGPASAQINRTAPASGAYTVVIADGNSGFGGSGTYRLAVNGLTTGLKLCIPIVSSTNVNLRGIGGVSNATFILFTHTNVAAPRASWAPMLTNQFDQFGVFSRTNPLTQAERQRYFLLQQQ